MAIAVLWLDVETRQRWLRSRLRHFGGDDDLILTYVRAVEANDQGRATEAVALSQRVLDLAWEQGREVDPDLVPLLTGAVLGNLVLARLLSGSLHHDDPLLPSTVGLLRPQQPMMAGWVMTYWSLAALVDGDELLARSMSEESAARTEPLALEGLRPPVAMIAAVLAAADGPDDDRARGLADLLLPAMAAYDRLGSETRAALVRFTVAHLYDLAGEPASAATHRTRADVALLTFEDAPFVAAFRDVLDSRLAAARAAQEAAHLGPFEALTAREREVLRELATPRSMAEIAAHLNLSPHTVRSHARSIYRKLQVRGRLEAVLRAEGIGERRPAGG